MGAKNNYLGPKIYLFEDFRHNPNDNTTQHNLNIVVGLDTKMTVQAPPPHPPHKLNSSLHK